MEEHAQTPPEDATPPADNAATPPASEDKTPAGNVEPEQTGSENAGQGNQDKVEPEAEKDPELQPITKWEDVDLGLPKDADINQELLAQFGKQAVALGLNPKQARALAQWNYEAGLAMRQQLLEDGTAQLKKAWGNNYEARRNAALTLVSQLDRELGDEAFSKALNMSGAACHAPIVMGLAYLAGRLSEDSMGKCQPDAASRPETALEGLQNALAEARRK